MLHAPTNEPKPQSATAPTLAPTEPGREIHPPMGSLDRPTGFPSSAAQLHLHYAGLQQTIGNQAVLRMLNRSAEPQHAVTSLNSGRVLRRKCACRASGDECASCKEKREQGIVQRKAAGPSDGSKAPPIVHEVLRSPGRPLDPSTRAFFEPRFGYDFGEVRIHTDNRAAGSARSVGALAYTVGRDVVFAANRHEPSTSAGRTLLAHELTHVVQQSSLPTKGELKVGSARDERELEADRVSEEIMRNSSASVLRRSSDAMIQRACPPPKELGRIPAPEACLEEDPSERAPDHFGHPLRFCFDSDELIDADAGSLPLLGKELGIALLDSGRRAHVHGYASSPGGIKYNLKLACHRAAAVKRMVGAYFQSLNPIILHSHGATGAFGAEAENQRVIVSLDPPPPEPSIEIPAEVITAPRPVPELPMRKFSDCPASLDAPRVVSGALQEAILLVQSAIAYCEQSPPPKRVIDGLAEFFHVNATMLPQIVSKLRTIQSELGKGHTFECESKCSENSIAYTRPRSQCWFGFAVNIHLCPPFFNSPNDETPQTVTGVEANAGSLIHEIAHVSACVGDEIYYKAPGWETKPFSDLLDNADSYSEFVIYLTRR